MRGFRRRGVVDSHTPSPAYSLAVRTVKSVLAVASIPISTDVLTARLVYQLFGNNEPDYKNIDQVVSLFIRDHMKILHWMTGKGIIKRHLYEDDSNSYYWSLNYNDLTFQSSPPTEYNMENAVGLNAALVKKYNDILSKIENIVNDREPEDEEDEDEEDEPEVSKIRNYDDSALRDTIVKQQQKITELHEKVNDLEAHQINFKQKLADLDKTRKVELTIIRNGSKVVIKKQTHPVFAQVMFHIECGDNVMLVGPKGCGKSYVAGMVAEHLKLEFGMISMSGGTTESKLFGRVTPNITTGKQTFHPAKFTKMFEKGGCFLIDEVDAGDPNVLLALNSALSSGELEIENIFRKRHKKFVCIAAANTWGNGCDRQYVGRNQQDSAFTERFVQLEMTYDPNLELSLCPGAEEFVKKMHEYRERIMANKLERTLSTRFIVRAHNWLQHGKDVEYCESMLFSGWRADEIRKVKGGY